MTKKIYLLTLIPIVFSCVGCQHQESDSSSAFVPEVIEYTKIPNVANEGFYLEPGESKTIHINYELNERNYLRLDVLTDVNLYGTFEYRNLEDFDEKGWNHSMSQHL